MKAGWDLDLGVRGPGSAAMCGWKRRSAGARRPAVGGVPLRAFRPSSRGGGVRASSQRVKLKQKLSEVWKLSQLGPCRLEQQSRQVEKNPKQNAHVYEHDNICLCPDGRLYCSPPPEGDRLGAQCFTRHLDQKTRASRAPSWCKRVRAPAGPR